MTELVLVGAPPADLAAAATWVASLAAGWVSGLRAQDPRPAWPPAAA